ncbi:carbonic anhydrase [Zalerion maritima]|uniref:Carbonic anhydrase n=1 Tax=Zalerion maritima TaxID=339359 RepID=A0AAD5RFI7_9PEZI|nr:carbonic anhydrase [Zalerion maritima]
MRAAHPASALLSRSFSISKPRPILASNLNCAATKSSSLTFSRSIQLPALPSVLNWRTMDKSSISTYLRQSHDRVFERNAEWAAQQRAKDPDYFTKLASGQSPEYLWIGCSDSRIPAEAITGLEPGEAFIHRNIANLVCNVDLNAMSVIEYAIRHLQVKHIVVCGHYGCGGVKAAMHPDDLGLLNPWLRNIRDVYRQHEAELDTFDDEARRYNRLVELNVQEQCRNVIKTAALQQSFEEKGFPIVHGWVFGLHDGILKDLEIGFEDTLADVKKIYNLTGKN